MHYRHAFHAGNFADVFKHVALVALIQALNRKDAPWCFLDTHAGAGLYDLSDDALSDDRAGRTAEWRDGIGRLLNAGDLPEPIATYLRTVQHAQAFLPSPLWGGVGGGGARPPRVYPGSPWIARALARPGDRLVLCERVPEVAARLKQAFAGDARIAIHVRDGYEAHALLPPSEKRGLVFVDPPFERPDEFAAAAEFLKRARARFGHGVYAVWYPLKKRFDAGRFRRRVARESRDGALDLSVEIGAPAAGRMRGCGMLIVNPPFSFAAGIEPALKTLVRELAQDRAARCGIERVAGSLPGS